MAKRHRTHHLRCVNCRRSRCSCPPAARPPAPATPDEPLPPITPPPLGDDDDFDDEPGDEEPDGPPGAGAGAGPGTRVPVVPVLNAFSFSSQTIAPLDAVLFETLAIDESGTAFDFVTPLTGDLARVVRFNTAGLYEITYGLQVLTTRFRGGVLFGAMINLTTIIRQSQHRFATTRTGNRMETIKFAYRSAGGGETLAIRNLDSEPAAVLANQSEGNDDMSAFIVVDRLGA